MQFSYITYSIGALALGQLSTAHPTNKTTIAATTNTTADIPRVTLKNTHDNFDLPVSVAATILVHTNTTTYSQHAYTLTSASTCSDLCHDDSQKNCIMATYKNSTELCLLHINMQDIKGMPKSAQCPLGLQSSGYEKVEENSDEKEAVWMAGPCWDPGDGSVGCTFGM